VAKEDDAPERRVRVQAPRLGIERRPGTPAKNRCATAVRSDVTRAMYQARGAASTRVASGTIDTWRPSRGAASGAEVARRSRAREDPGFTPGSDAHRERSGRGGSGEAQPSEGGPRIYSGVRRPSRAKRAGRNWRGAAERGRTPDLLRGPTRIASAASGPEVARRSRAREDPGFTPGSDAHRERSERAGTGEAQPSEGGPRIYSGVRRPSRAKRAGAKSIAAPLPIVVARRRK